jgi:hypothetical protein
MPTTRYNPLTLILKDFRRTFVDHRYKNEPINYTAFALFWIVPVILSLVAIALNLILTVNLINVLLIALSVFAALLFNILLLIYDVSHKSKNSPKDMVDPKILQTYVRDTFTAISFSVLISILAIVFLIVASFGIEYDLFSLIIRFIIYFLVAIFVMSLFIDLRRIYVLLQYEIDNKQ